MSTVFYTPDDTAREEIEHAVVSGGQDALSYYRVANAQRDKLLKIAARHIPADVLVDELLREDM